MTSLDGRSPDRPDAADVLVLCTGNAARSVMAGCMLAQLAEDLGTPLRITTAGTHALEGQPASLRTRAALAGMGGFGDRPLSAHRSRQLDAFGLDRVDLVVAMEADHVRYVRRRFPDAAPRTATLRRLCRDLPPPPPGLADRVRGLELDQVVLDDAEDVADPAGGDDETYALCAAELWGSARSWPHACEAGLGPGVVHVHRAQPGPRQVGQSSGQSPGLDLRGLTDGGDAVAAGPRQRVANQCRLAPSAIPTTA